MIGKIAAAAVGVYGQIWRLTGNRDYPLSVAPRRKLADQAAPSQFLRFKERFIAAIRPLAKPPSRAALDLKSGASDSSGSRLDILSMSL